MAPPAPPAHRHQLSLEGLIDFSALQPVFADADERARVITRFYRIVGHFEAIETRRSSNRPQKEYNRPALVRLMFEYIRTPESQDNFLQAFFRSMALGVHKDDDHLELEDNGMAADLGQSLSDYADYLFNYFFLPCTLLIAEHLVLALIPSKCGHRQIRHLSPHLYTLL